MIDEEYLNKNILNERLDTPEDKLKWIFNVFDRDGGGSIDAAEIQEMVSGLFAMAGVREHLVAIYEVNTDLDQVDIAQEDLLDCTEEIMEAIDVDGDGDITRVNSPGPDA